MFHECSLLSSHESDPRKPSQRPFRRRVQASHREGVMPLRKRGHLRSARTVVLIRAQGMERQAARGTQEDALPAMLLREADADAGHAGIGQRGADTKIADAGYHRVETAIA